MVTRSTESFKAWRFSVDFNSLFDALDCKIGGSNVSVQVLVSELLIGLNSMHTYHAPLLLESQRVAMWPYLK